MSRAATPATTRTVAATNSAAMAVSRVGRLTARRAGFSRSVRLPLGPSAPSPVEAAGGRRSWWRWAGLAACRVRGPFFPAGGRSRPGCRPAAPGRAGRWSSWWWWRPGRWWPWSRLARGRRAGARCPGRRRTRRTAVGVAAGGGVVARPRASWASTRPGGDARCAGRRGRLHHPEGDRPRGRDRLAATGPGQHPDKEQQRRRQGRRRRPSAHAASAGASTGAEKR